MRLVLVSLLTLMLGGCAAFKGTAFDGRLCMVWTEQDIPGEIDRIVKLYPPGTDRDKVERALAYARAAHATGTAICELIRSIEGAMPTEGAPHAIGNGSLQ